MTIKQDIHPALSTPWAGWLHPELAPVHDGLVSLSRHLNYISWNVPSEDDLLPHEIQALAWLEALPRFANGLAVSAPIMHPDVCDLLIAEANDPTIQWEPNDDEDEDYQIPEVVLKHKIPALHDSLHRFAERTLFMIMELVWAKRPGRVESIQLAKYTPEGTQHGNWHHDEDSNMTGVINLAPELYQGGGTDIRTGIRTYDHVPPVPKGHALIFNGHQTLHRGAPVLSGERNILVYWATTGRN